MRGMCVNANKHKNREYVEVCMDCLQQESDELRALRQEVAELRGSLGIIRQALDIEQ